MTWLILPGWGLPPKDYEKLADLLGPDTRTLDSWKVPLTADTDDIRAELGASDSQKVDLLGQSLGGLAAIEWALRRPGQVRQLVLIDPTAPDEVPSHFHVEGKLRRGMDKLAGAAVEALWRVGPKIRRWGIRQTTGSEDTLPINEARARYGTRENSRRLAEPLPASWVHAARVDALLDVGAHKEQRGRRPAPLLLVGAGSGKQRRFLRSQWDLGRKLHARTIMLTGQNHVFPLTRPGLVVRHIENP